MRGHGVLGGLAGLAALSVLVGPLAAQAPPPGTAAVVNGEAVPVADVMLVISQNTPPATPLTESQKRELQIAAVQTLIEQALMRQFLAKNAPPPAPKDIEMEYADLQASLKKDKMSMADFYKETGQTEAQLRAEIVMQLQWRTYLTPKLPDSAVKAYYDANKPFFDKVFVRASHVLIRLAPNASAAERQVAQAKLSALRQEIVAGKIDFADAARKFSDCPSKQNGGDIGPFPYKFAVLEPFAKAAFAMKVGDVSDVVATDFGLHLIKVTNRDNGQPSDFMKLKDDVRQICAREMYQAVVAEQRRSARIEVFFPAEKK